jgi:hypothetical protein
MDLFLYFKLLKSRRICLFFEKLYNKLRNQSGEFKPRHNIDIERADSAGY